MLRSALAFLAMQLSRVAGRANEELSFLKLVLEAGIVRPMGPGNLARIVKVIKDHGMIGGLVSINAIRYGDAAAIVDDLGSLSYAELDRASNAVANAWRDRGVQPGDGISILARNHRWFVVAFAAASKLGARIVLLNTDFAGPQLREVAGREGTELLAHDDEYAAILEGIEPRLGRYRAWADEESTDAALTLAEIITRGNTRALPSPGQSPKVILLTSGTTGTPKGAPRAEPRGLAAMGTLLSRIPFRRGVTLLPAPMFHTLGFANLLFGMALGSTLVVHRHFSPAVTVQDLHEHQATSLIAVPVMLQRMVDLPAETFDDLDFSHLRVVFVAGSQLGVDLAQRCLATFGPTIYNMYGSTEIAYATVATPEDLAAEPGCVGKPFLGVTIKLFDDEGNEVPPGRTGRIFVGNGFQFEGYTGGGDKERIQGLMSSGDVGHFDAEGRLFIDGRDDDMIVSGGENVFPGEVEELLAAHPSVREVAAIGVPDEKFGQRLTAFVVVHEGAALTSDEVRDHVKENLARYKVPKSVHFLDELPRNPTGKVLKRKLAELTD